MYFGLIKKKGSGCPACLRTKINSKFKQEICKKCELPSLFYYLDINGLKTEENRKKRF